MEELIYDDESVSKNQHILPRMIGGGRKHQDDFNYVCLWCPNEDINKGKIGRYKELKNYRDHFRKYHHSEDGKGISMTQFIDKVQRCEPTWFCPTCKQHKSVGNVLRHKVICQQAQDEETTDSDVEIISNDNQQTIYKKRQEENKKTKTGIGSSLCRSSDKSYSQELLSKDKFNLVDKTEIILSDSENEDNPQAQEKDVAV